MNINDNNNAHSDITKDKQYAVEVKRKRDWVFTNLHGKAWKFKKPTWETKPGQMGFHVMHWFTSIIRVYYKTNPNKYQT